MTGLEKLRVLLPHWIAHNHEHIAEIDRWAKLCEASNTQVKEALKKAIGSTEKVNEELQHALDLAGGPIERHDEPHGHHQGHGHTHHEHGKD